MTEANTTKREAVAPAILKSFNDVFRELKRMKPPLSDEVKQQFLNKLTTSPSKKYFAFRLLVLQQADRQANKIVPFEGALLSILSEGDKQENIDKLDGKSASEWVCSRFPRVTSKADARKFLETQSHLWIFYQILCAWHNRPVFTASLAAYAESFENLLAAGRTRKENVGQTTSHVQEYGGRAGRTRKENVGQTRFVEVIEHLGGKAPSKPKPLKNFREVLRFTREWALLPNYLQQELESVKAEKQKWAETAEGLQTELENNQQELEQRQSQITNLESRLAAIEKELNDHKKALTMQAGLHQTEKSGEMLEAVAKIKSYCMPRLEDIRLFADRDQPNKDAILRKVAEIEEKLRDLNTEQK